MSTLMASRLAAILPGTARCSHEDYFLCRSLCAARMCVIVLVLPCLVLSAAHVSLVWCLVLSEPTQQKTQTRSPPVPVPVSQATHPGLTQFQTDLRIPVKLV